MEEIYVKEIYNKIGSYFDKTRAYLWNGVKLFLNSIDKNSLVLDIGCGNGKNMLYRKDCQFIGIDNSKTLVEICNEKGLNAILADMRVLPFNDNKFDHLISVASFHHIEKEEDRIKTLIEFARVLKKGGKLFLQVWDNMDNKNDKKFKKLDKEGDYLVKWQNPNKTNTFYRYYHLMNKEEIINLITKTSLFNILNISYEMQNWVFIIEKI